AASGRWSQAARRRHHKTRSPPDSTIKTKARWRMTTRSAMRPYNMLASLEGSRQWMQPFKRLEEVRRRRLIGWVWIAKRAILDFREGCELVRLGLRSGED